MKLKLTILDPRFPALFFTGQLYNLMTNETSNAACAGFLLFSYICILFFLASYLLAQMCNALI